MSSSARSPRSSARADRARLGALAFTAASVIGCSDHCGICKVDTPDHASWPMGNHQPKPEPGKHILSIDVGESRHIVPGPGLPESIEPGLSNNNLDVVRWDGWVYLAFRTAPSHFASKDARLVVVRSRDEVDWELVHVFARGRDLREPRFLAAFGALRLFVTELGVDKEKFEPGQIKVSSLDSSGGMSDLEDAPFDRGTLLWRTVVRGDRAFLTYYTGGEEIYRPIELLDKNKLRGFLELLLPGPLTAGTVQVHLAQTTNGVDFTKVASPMHTGGASETALAFDEDGNGYAVMRTELPEQGFAGSNVCHASSTDLSKWTCTHDKRKFDSPLLFEHDGEIYLIARRNLAQEGAYATDSIVNTDQYVLTQAAYSCSRKRCSIWRYVKGEDRIAYVTDLPSWGDTCFPSVISGEKPDEVIVYDYSAPLTNSREERWCEAQTHYTQVYRHVLHFSPNDGTRTQAGAYHQGAALPAEHCCD
ncbi:MAG: hypothetical protein U0271_14000 [Polyangiaceae bacterium]